MGSIPIVMARAVQDNRRIADVRPITGTGML
jgi:hypothetical protein